MTQLRLRPYQLAALQESKKRFDAGLTKQIVQLPTGLGKTCVFSSLRSYFGFTGKVLVLVHREELAQQAADKLRNWNPELQIGIEMADKVCSDSDNIVVGSVPTLGRKNSTRLLKFNAEEFDCVVVDEVHHSTGESYKNVLSHFSLYGEPKDTKKRLLWGTTATPNRGDGEPLAEVYDEIVYQMPILQAIEEGWLCELRGKSVHTATSLSKVSTRAGDFALNDLADAVNNYRRNDLAVRTWKELASDRQTIVFAVDVAHAKALQEVYEHNDVASCAIWADDPDRAIKLKLFKDGKLPVVVNVGILTEGFDYWNVQCVLLARPTQSRLLYTQMIGRGTRIQEGINNLIEARAAGVPITKPDCLVIDIVDNSAKHSLESLATLFGLPGNLNLNGEKVTRAVKAIKEKTDAYPELDISQLESLDKLEGMIRDIDLFKVVFAPEVLKYATMQWSTMSAGGWILHIPNNQHEAVSIWQDLLNHWHANGTVEGNKFDSGQLPNVGEAFRFAEQMVRTFGHKYVTLLRREGAGWHKDAITPGQKMMLKQLTGRQAPATMSKGEASLVITRMLKDRARL